MDIENAPQRHEDEERECGLCEAEGTIVVYDGDKVCKNCGHTPGPSRGTADEQDEWAEWFEHRREYEEYSGWFGENRIKFVGGFADAY